MSASHTPGPWRVGSLLMSAVFVHAGSDTEGIADCGFPREAEENEANARLIAAAPDLLAALKWVAGVVRHKSMCPASGTLGPESCSCDLKRIHAAIAKAEGR